MPWVKIDDNFYEHPKVTMAGLEATAIYVLSLSFSARYLTDGFIPEVQALRFAVGAHEPAETLLQRLVDVGLWERVSGGYQIGD